MPEVPDNHVVDTDALQKVLSSAIALPDEGVIHHLATIEGVKVLVWKFTEFTPCSSASENNFKLVSTPKRYFDFKDPCPKGHISLPFFLIENDEDTIFRDKTNKIVNELFMYPEVSEDDRMNALYDSLHLHRYNVKRCKSTKTTEHYCEFSGGGDIYICNKNISTPLVFTSPTAGETELAQPDEGSSVGGGGVKVSPVTYGTSKLSSLSIEGKKGSISSMKLKHQLWANMITVIIGNFIKAVNPPKSQPVNQSLFTKHDLFKLNEFTGYGVACSGDGMVGIYKAEIKFGKVTSFVTKLELGCRNRLLAASLIDFTLQYYSARLMDKQQD